MIKYILISLFTFFQFFVHSHDKAQAMNLEALEQVCYDGTRFGQVMQVYTGAAAGGSSELIVSIANVLSNNLQGYCDLIIMLHQMKTGEDALNALRLANSMWEWGLDNSFNFYDSTKSMVDFATKLRDSKASTKDKLLNANNHRRFVNYYRKWGAALCPPYNRGCLKEGAAEEEMATIQSISSNLQVMKEKASLCLELPRGMEGKKKGDVLYIAGREKDASKALAEFQTYLDSEQSLEISRMAVQTIYQILIEMNTITVHKNPEKLEQINLVLSEYVSSTFWLGVGYKFSDTLENGEKVVVENVIDKTKVTSKDIEKNAPYFRAGQRIGIDCKNAKLTRNELEYDNWKIANAAQGSRHRLEDIVKAQALQTCPFKTGNYSFNSVQNMPISDIVFMRGKDVSSAQEEEQMKQVKEAMIDSCLTKTAKQVMQATHDSGVIGISGMGAGRSALGNRKKFKTCEQEVKEKMEQSRPPLLGEEMDEASTVGELVEYLNERFDFFARQQINHIKESGFSDSIRDTSNWLDRNAFGSNEESKSASYTADQSAFNQKWKRYSRCNDLFYIKKKYSEDWDKIENGGQSASINQFTSLVQKCQEAEASVEMNYGLYRYYFDAISEHLQNIVEIQMNRAKYELTYHANGYEEREKAPQCQKELSEVQMAQMSNEIGMESLKAQMASVKLLNRLYDEQRKMSHAKDMEVENARRENKLQVLRYIDRSRQTAYMKRYLSTIKAKADMAEVLREITPSIRSEKEMYERGVREPFKTIQSEYSED